MAKKRNKAEKLEKDLKKYVKDVTFGMKNKNNSKKMDKMVKGLAGERGGYDKIQSEKFNTRKKQRALEKEEKFMADVFAGSALANAKTKKKKIKSKPICQFFKAGLCTKGKKCKYSHDLSAEEVKVEASTNKINLFKDQREEIFGNEDTIQGWGQKELEEAVNFNAKKYTSSSNQTVIVCKFFLDAVAKMRYGWFWKCPNGYNCKFKHCLPPGYKFKNKKGAKSDQPKEDTELNLIREIDEAREKLVSSNTTEITYERFMAWVKKRRIKKKKEREERIKKFMSDRGFKIRKNVTGRQLFDKNQGLFKDAEGAVGNYKKEKEAEKEKEDVEVDENMFGEDVEMPDL